MATNGMKRLKDKHSNKKAERARIETLLEQLMPLEDAPNNVESTQRSNSAEGQKDKICRKTAQSPSIPNMKELESLYFNDIWSKLAEIHENPTPFRLAAENLAKILAQCKRLEDQMEQDGGPIQCTQDSRYYAHPAIKLIQAYHSQILTHLKAMGMSVQGKPGPKKEEDMQTSVFAQFQ